MDLGTEFYSDWFTWAEARAPQLVKENPLLLMEFAADLSQIVKGDVALFTSMAKVTRGRVLGIALGLARWVGDHPDPLKMQREAMRAMRVKYGEVTHAK